MISTAILIWLILSVFFFPKWGQVGDPTKKLSPLKVALFLPLALCFILYRLAAKVWN